MKKVARITPTNMNEEVSSNPTPSPNLNNEPAVRTTGRIKKPKAVFDPSDNYLPRAQRLSSVATPQPTNQSSSQERRASYTKAATISPVGSTESTVSAKEACACVVCKKRESKRPIFANKNPLISCLGCEKKIHKVCLKIDFEDSEYLQNNYKCEQCSVCKICDDKFNNPDEEIITCSKCVKSFHINCFPTKIIKTEINQRNWKCNKCQVLNQITNGTTLPVKKIREIIGGVEPASTPTSPPKSTAATSNKTSPISNINNDNSVCTSLLGKRSHDGDNKNESIKSDDSINNGTSPATAKSTKSSNSEIDDSLNSAISTPPPEKHTKTSKNQSIDNVILNTQTSSNTQPKLDSSNLCFSPDEHIDLPDVKHWSFDQVYDYFAKHFPKEAHVFKDEEIDGRSLLLLKRSDIVKKLPIKLGPSLRIYSLILKIQAQVNDPTLGWNCGL